MKNFFINSKFIFKKGPDSGPKNLGEVISQKEKNQIKLDKFDKKAAKDWLKKNHKEATQIIAKKFTSSTKLNTPHLKKFQVEIDALFNRTEAQIEIINAKSKELIKDAVQEFTNEFEKRFGGNQKQLNTKEYSTGDKDFDSLLKLHTPKIQKALIELKSNFPTAYKEQSQFIHTILNNSYYTLAKKITELATMGKNYNDLRAHVKNAESSYFHKFYKIIPLELGQSKENHQKRLAIAKTLEKYDQDHQQTNQISKFIGNQTNIKTLKTLIRQAHLNKTESIINELWSIQQIKSPKFQALAKKFQISWINSHSAEHTLAVLKTLKEKITSTPDYLTALNRIPQFRNDLTEITTHWTTNTPQEVQTEIDSVLKNWTKKFKQHKAKHEKIHDQISKYQKLFPGLDITKPATDQLSSVSILANPFKIQSFIKTHKDSSILKIHDPFAGSNVEFGKESALLKQNIATHLKKNGVAVNSNHTIAKMAEAYKKKPKIIQKLILKNKIKQRKTAWTKFIQQTSQLSKYKKSLNQALINTYPKIKNAADLAKAEKNTATFVINLVKVHFVNKLAKTKIEKRFPTKAKKVKDLTKRRQQIAKKYFEEMHQKSFTTAKTIKDISDAIKKTEKIIKPLIKEHKKTINYAKLRRQGKKMASKGKFNKIQSNKLNVDFRGGKRNPLKRYENFVTINDTLKPIAVLQQNGTRIKVTHPRGNKSVIAKKTKTGWKIEGQTNGFPHHHRTKRPYIFHRTKIERVNTSNNVVALNWTPPKNPPANQKPHLKAQQQQLKLKSASPTGSAFIKQNLTNHLYSPVSILNLDMHLPKKVES